MSFIKKFTTSVICIFLISTVYGKKTRIDKFEIILQKVLGPEIIWLANNEGHTRKSILKRLGKANLEKKEKLSYIKNNYKYALNISLNDDKIVSFSYKLTDKKKLSLEELQKIIPTKNIYAFPKTGHNKGRFIALKHNNLILIFKNNSKKNLVRVNYAR